MAKDAASSYVETEKLADWAADYVRSLSAADARQAGTEARRVHRCLRQMERSVRQLARDEAGQAAEWLLDNRYLIRNAGLAAAETLVGLGRQRRITVTAAARALVRISRGQITAERLGLFLAGLQRTPHLAGRELEGLPAALCAALTEAAAHAALALARGETVQPRYVGACVTALRLLSQLDLRPLLEWADPAEQILRQDPAGVYPQMDEITRAEYRRRTAALARRQGKPIWETAQALIDRAGAERCHVGVLLYPPRYRDGTGYLALMLGLPAGLALGLGLGLSSVWAGLAAWLPAWSLVKLGTDRLLSRFSRPGPLPRLELQKGIPPRGRTLCVITALLTGPADGPRLARLLEEYRLANRDSGPELLFGLLADLPEAAAPALPGDGPALAAAAAAIGALNDRWGGGFCLLTRPRSYAAADGVWRGRERKRGALAALAALVLGQDSELTCAAGETPRARFILTLDEDTRLCPGTARQLVGTMLHPLNTPVAENGRVTAGHGVIHPRVETALPAAMATPFARLFSGGGGLDPYGGAVGEPYQNRYDRGGFAGKGLLDAAALLAIQPRLPVAWLLSHDAVEGALLRGGFAGDIVLTDGCPAGALAWGRRCSRWTRGDWQNLRWMTDPAFPPIEREKLLDGARRSLLPGWVLGAVTGWLLCPGPAAALPALLALLSLTAEELLTLLGLLTQPGGPAPVSGGLGDCLARLALAAALLPWRAWIRLRAVGLALWRMLVSHRLLLQWTPASAPVGRGFSACLRDARTACLWGAALLALAPGVWGKTAGVLWLLTPLLLHDLSRSPAAPALSEADRQYLLDHAGEIWGFFRDFCGPEDHWLPPDNVQSEPALGPAHRTSPTNIGLALTACLAAADLGLEPPGTAAERISRTLDTLEAMPKWHGHLYNWYDTRTVMPLSPVYVSAVDSGNLAACLLTVSAGLGELGYTALSRRAGELARAMDFSPLYDSARMLLRLGWDVQRDMPGEGWYDLYASEARLTAYVAMAKGDVPLRLWRQLSRAQTGSGLRRGCVSWTGTMFEYLMPELFLPLFPGSLANETARFCLDRQKHRSSPWGISESAYWAFDPAMNYRYKAHGVADLAYKRGMDTERVVSPYSSFLALPWDASGAVANLRALDKLGARGPWGFWEAVDFTPARAGDGRVVRCVMAHHLGMSLAALDNALHAGAMRRRFLTDPAMASCVSLLQEKPPLGGRTVSRLGEQPPAIRRRAGDYPARTGQGTDWEKPTVCLLSNGWYALRMAETGAVRAQCGSLLVWAAPRQPAPDGPAWLVWQTGDTRLPLVPEESGKNFTWHFSPDRGTIRCRTDDLTAGVTLWAADGEPGELRTVRLCRENGPLTGTLHLTLTPVLAPEREYLSHKTYCGLGLRGEQTEGAVYLRRLARGHTPETWLCLLCDRPAAVTFSRTRDGAGEQTGGWLAYPCLHLTVPVNAAAGETAEVCFSAAVARTQTGAARAAREILQARVPSTAVSDAAAMLGLDGAGWQLAMDLAADTAFPETPRPAAAPYLARCRAGKPALWAMGISGDLPLVCLQIPDDDAVRAARPWLAAQALLSAAGLDTDLVLLTPDAGEYRPARSTALLEQLRALDREGAVGAPGGVHFVPLTEDNTPLLAAAAVICDPARPGPRRPRDLTEPGQPLPRALPVGDPAVQWAADGTVSFSTENGLPRRAWGHMLTNGAFGYFAADCGTGHMWYQNARLCPIGGWPNDPMAVNGPETLALYTPAGRCSLFAGEAPCRVEYGFGWASWETRTPAGPVSVTAFVPPEVPCRVLIVRGGAGELVWQTALTLSGEPGDASFVVTRQAGDMLLASGSRTGVPGTEFSAVASRPWTGFTCDEAAARRRDWDGAAGAGLAPCFAMAFSAGEPLVLVCGCAPAGELRALCGAQAAEAALAETRALWQRRVCALRVETPEPRLDRYLNGWAAYQTLAGRLLGRTGLYQSGGAYGFRDQLQDGANLLELDPLWARERILAACARQYTQGDVQHWWHPGGMGVRTRCSDDLLWLVWAAAEYVTATGDAALLTETVPWLDSRPLAAGEHDRGEIAPVTAERSTVREHCLRAMELVLARGTGQHGLLYMLAGDWNDGMDAAGADGGESTWLTWFFVLTARHFTALPGAGEREAALDQAAAKLLAAAEDTWDGAWYRRVYFGDGTPLGSAQNRCCRLDSIAQSFAALCPGADRTRAGIALESAAAALFDRERGIVRLFTPPFDAPERDPGYITGYGPGFRENGGQYTHGAVWLAHACLETGKTELGWAILLALLPGDRGPGYEAEPYVLAADVYDAPGQQGRAGWTWYTGSAGWYYRIALRAIRRGQLPAAWQGQGQVTEAENPQKS